MNPLTLEWVEKAEGDFITASREFRAREAPNFYAVCFHAQQMAEKYLKYEMRNKLKWANQAFLQGRPNNQSYLF